MTLEHKPLSDDDLNRNMREFRDVMFRWMKFSWLGLPIALLAPLWNAVRSPPGTDDTTGFIILGVLLVPMMVIAWRLVHQMGRIFSMWDTEDVEIAAARSARRQLSIRRAERLARARERLARLQAIEDRELLAGLTEDVLLLRDELAPRPPLEPPTPPTPAG